MKEKKILLFFFNFIYVNNNNTNNYYYYFFNGCYQYLPELQYKAKSKCEVELYFLHVIVQYVCCILLLCWYTCNQSYIEQFFNLHISTLHPSAISSISFKNQVNMKYMQSVFPLLPFHIMKMSRHN